MLKVFDIAAQLLVLVLIVHAAAYSYKIAKWSCARSVQWLTAGFAYILVWRVVYSALQIHKLPSYEWVEQNQTYFIIPAYFMWAWGLYLLYKTLMNLGRKS